MDKKQGVKLVNKQMILGVIIAVFLIGGSSAYAVNVQHKAETEKAALVKEKEKAAYHKLLLEVNKLVKKAYDSRSSKDIETARKKVEELKEVDQKGQKEQLILLDAFLGQIKKTDQLLATAEKSKKDSDIEAAQNSINEEKDTYLAKDKKAHQVRLDQIKKVVSDQKAKAEKEKKAKEEQEKAQAQAQTQGTTNEPAVTETPTAEVASVTETASETPVYEQPAEQAPVYEEPAQQPEAPVTPDPTPAPAAPATSTPSSGNGILSQEELNQGEKEISKGGSDAASNWDEVFGKK